MSNLSTFVFENITVRADLKNNEPIFVASDICAGLEISNPRQAVAALQKNLDDAGIKDVISNDTLIETSGGVQNVLCVNETGLNLLIMQSRKKEAIRFKHWIASEVLPTIRKTGSYTAPERKTKQVLIGKLTADQQDAIKALVNSRIDSVPKEKQRGTAMKLWGAINRKFGTKTYKDIDPSEFINVLSLVSRLPLEGELMPRNEAPAIPEGMVLVRKDLLEETNNMIKMIDERFALLEHAESRSNIALKTLSVAQALLSESAEALREARYRLIDPIKHAKSYTSLMLN